MATAQPKNVYQILTEEYFFDVPSYQRGYRWETTHIIKLLEDLIKFKNQKADKRYCLQPIMVKKIEHKDHDKKYKLIDGQQRLTSLWILQALYYVFDRNSIKEWKNITISFEGKSYYEKIFVRMKEVLCDEENDRVRKLIPAIQKLREEEFPPNKNVDVDHFFNNITALLEYTFNGSDISGLLNEIFYIDSAGASVIKRVDIIWYELDPQENEIEAFTNINANKIPLTESELIKAHFLYKFSHCEKKADSLEAQVFGDLWEQMEQKLGDKEYWSFLNADKSCETGTRIDLLFQILCRSNNIELDAKSDYPMFDAIEKYIRTQGEENTKDEAVIAHEMWKDIVKIEGFLYDWYKDFFYYHAIGLLIMISKENSDVILDKLCKKYQSLDENIPPKPYTKESFKKKITEYLKAALGNFENLEETLNSLTYTNKDEVRRFLLVYNIAVIINAKCQYERFPFEEFSSVENDVEHLNPQIQTAETEHLPDTKILELIKIYEPEVLEELENSNKLSPNERQRCRKLLGERQNVHNTQSIGNLVLLDSNTNRSPEYSSKKFVDKKEIIKTILRTGKRNGEQDEDVVKYIPIGTKWVFLNGFAQHSQEHTPIHDTIDSDGHWCGHQHYIKDIIYHISTFLNSTNKENANEINDILETV